MSYAKIAPGKDGAYVVNTPGRGFSLIEGLDEQAAHNVARCINKAYEDGLKDARRDVRNALGIVNCTCD